MALSTIGAGVTASQMNELNELESKLNSGNFEKEAEEELFKMKLSHTQTLVQMQIDAAAKDQKAEEEAHFEAMKRIAALDARKKALEKKNEKDLTKRERKELDALKKQYDEKDKLEKKFEEAAKKRREKEEKKKEAERQKTNQKEHAESVFGAGKSLKERAEGLKNMFQKQDEDGNNIGFSFGKGLDEMTKAISDMAKQLDSKIDQIAGYKTSIDTRLQGSNNKTKSGSYWDAMTGTITSVAGISPYIKQSDLANNIQKMVSQGIAFNVDQRAFLSTISDKIATTFDAANGTLLRIIRIQQADSTAARLGMESALTSYLNNMFSSTEYLTDQSLSVKSALEEAEALMTTEDATAFEYQVQKWLGSLYSTGMSSASISGLATAIGQLSSGNISGLTGSNYGNLLIMAANNADLPLSSLLSNGLNAESTNQLMTALVSYLQNIAGQTSGNKLLGQQYANIFGLSASDLKAASNIGTSLNSISMSSLGYGSALGQLSNMTKSIGQRVSLGEQLGNLWDNIQYSMASGIAGSPALYGIYKVAGLLDAVAGGIHLPDILAAGFGAQLNTTVADLMRVGALSGGIISSMGQLISGGGGLSTQSLLNAMGFSGGAYNTAITSRGDSGSGFTSSGYTTSQSGYIGNSSSSDVYNATMASKENEVNAVSAQGEEGEEKKLATDANKHVIEIYKLLERAVNGSNPIKVINTLETSSAF